MHTRNSVLPEFRFLVVTLSMVFSSMALAGTVHTYTDQFDLRIPADSNETKGWMQDAVINVPDHLTIYDLDVGITLEHANDFDLELYIQSPEGTTLCLNKYDPAYEYFSGADYTQTIFDDEAGTPIEDGNAPFTGRFRPKAIDADNLLKVFDGQDAYGDWRLQIYDARYSDTGRLKEVELMITVPEPASVLLLTLAAGFVKFFGPRRSR